MATKVKRILSRSNKPSAGGAAEGAGRPKRLPVLLLTAFFALVICACSISAEKIEYARAEEAVQKKDFPSALKHYKAVVDRYVKTDLAIKSAKEAARIAHYEQKNFRDAVGFYKHVVLYSSNPKERLDSQKKIADLQFNQILDYNQAIIEYSRLLELPHSKKDDFDYRMAIARSYFYLSNFFQSQVEIDGVLARGYEKEWLFEALLLKANIFLTTKKLDDAILVLRRLIDEYPERSKAETIGLILAVCYEEQKNFAKAIETLQSIKDIYPRRAFIENRIKALRERQAYLPGARGLRK